MKFWILFLSGDVEEMDEWPARELTIEELLRLLKLDDEELNDYFWAEVADVPGG